MQTVCQVPPGAVSHRRQGQLPVTLPVTSVRILFLHRLFAIVVNSRRACQLAWWLAVGRILTSFPLHFVTPNAGRTL